MKYLVRTNETHNVTVEYLVKANSGDEAIKQFREKGQIVDEIFNSIEDEEIIDVEPWPNEN